MKPWFCRLVVGTGRRILRLCSSGRVLGQVPETGGFLLAANHTHFFDSGLILGACPRHVRWLTIVRVETGPWSWFFRRLGLIEFRRGGRDLHAMKRVVQLARGGEIVGIFPEGGIRHGAASVTGGAHIDGRLARLSEMSGVPVIPCICEGAEPFSRLRGWMPWSRHRWAVVFGDPVPPGPQQTEEVQRAFVALHVRAVSALRE